MGAGGENSSGGWKEQFASRDGPGKRRTLGNAMCGRGEIMHFCSCHMGIIGKEARRNMCLLVRRLGIGSF